MERDGDADKQRLERLKREHIEHDDELERIRRETQQFIEKAKAVQNEIQRQRDQAQKTKEEQELQEIETIKQYKLDREEALKRRRMLDEQEAAERLRIKKRDEEEETERLRLIKISTDMTLKYRQKLNELKEEESLKISMIRQMEEEEAVRMKKLVEEEASVMLTRLKAVEEEEAERRKQKRIKRLEQELYQEKLKNLKRAELEAEKLKNSHFKMINSKRVYTSTSYVGSLDYDQPFVSDSLEMPIMMEDDLSSLGITEDEIDMQCDELFLQAPIEFKPKKNNEIDQILAKIIKDLNITIPIVNVKDSVYLVGSQRVNLIPKRDSLVVKRGGGSQQFQEFYLLNKTQLQRSLVINMIKSGESLEHVVNCLVSGQKVRDTTAESTPSRNTNFRSSVSSRYSPTSAGRPSLSLMKGRPERLNWTSTYQTIASRSGDMSPAEKKYREQKDKILNDLKSAMT